MLGLMRELKAMGKLVVFIEHDIASGSRGGGFGCGLDEGKIIAQGRPVEVLERREIIEAYVG